MTKNEIVESIAKEKLVERIVYKIACTTEVPENNYLEDLISDIYLILLQKEDDLIINLYERDELGFYIIRIARNQLLSKNSPYYRDYMIPILKKNVLEDIYEAYPE